MEQSKYLAEYEIESLACLEQDIDTVNLAHPNKIYEVELKNKHVEIGEKNPILTAYIIFYGSSLDDAEEKCKIYIKEYVDLLTFSTNIRFRAGNLLKVVEWTPGITERECYIYSSTYHKDGRPYPVVNQDIISTIESLLVANISPLFRRVLKWFANGVSSDYQDDQFQYFWFVLELLSELFKKTEKVNDLCPKCRKPLYCKNCDENPMHRPYPKQAIKYLFKLIIKDKTKVDEIFDILNKIRNALMHGDDINTIESNLKIDFSEYVDKLGQLAWTAIMNAFANSFEKPQKLKLNLIQASTYRYETMRMTTHISFKSKDPNNPRIEDIPNVDTSLTFG